MNFQRSEEQQMIIENLRKYLDSEIEPAFREHGEGFIPREKMQEWTQGLTEFGLIKAPFGEEWGGFGMYAVHHTATLLGWGTAAVTGFCHNLAIPAQLFEATGPFTNLRWFLSAAGLKSTKLYLANGVAMFLSFLVLRVVFNIWLCVVRFGTRRLECRSRSSLPSSAPSIDTGAHAN